MPAASGASGPTTVRSILLSFTALISDAMSMGFIGKLWACWDVPALPGAAKSSFTFGLWASFQTSVCSRAPLPATSIFIYLTPCVPLSFKGEGENM